MLGTLLNATANGNTVNLENISTLRLTLAANVGNGGSQVTEFGRRRRDLQVVVWTNTEVNREILSDPIDSLFAQLEYNFNLQMLDTSFGRLIYESDMYVEEGTEQDLYRRDFHVSVDYPVTSTDLLFSVLVPTLELSGIGETINGTTALTFVGTNISAGGYFNSAG